MGFNKFNFVIFVQILLFAASCMGMAYFIFEEPDVIYAAFVFLLICGEVIFLVKYLNRSNNALEAFIDSLHSDDQAIYFRKGVYPQSFTGIKEKLEKINADFQQVRIENITHYQKFKVMIDHVQTGLLAYDQTGKVSVCNKWLKDNLGIRNINHIEELRGISEVFYQWISQIPVASKRLVRVPVRNEIRQFALNAARYRFHGEWFVLVAVQDIKNELEENEIESWQKLTRILTHEIMNSVGPVVSAIDTLEELIYQNENKDLITDLDITNDIVADIAKGIHIIKERSSGMLDFVKNFRELTSLPVPDFKNTNLCNQIENVLYLFRPTFSRHQIRVKSEFYPEQLHLNIDKNMIEQVFINIINNAIHSFTSVNSAKEIKLKGYKKTDGHTVVEISDNGKGINESELQKIFIPFYTTREGGAGIGLSLCRQIMRLHNGTISIKSKQGIGTNVLLVF